MTVTKPSDGLLDPLLDLLVSLLLPASCLGCGAPLPARSGHLGLCGPCRDPLLRPRRADDGVCARCARPLEATALPPGWECGRCRRQPPAYDRLLAAWSYTHPVDAVIRALKFRRLSYLGPQLGRALAERFTVELRREATAAVVPLPLSRWRRLRRGFNQAELLALPLAHHLGVPASRCLRRRTRRAQSSLARHQRGSNPRGAFRVRGPLPGDRLLLVDDVVTTGATLDEAAACLKAAGARHVVAVVAARTPLRAEEAATPKPRRGRKPMGSPPGGENHSHRDI